MIVQCNPVDGQKIFIHQLFSQARILESAHNFDSALSQKIYIYTVPTSVPNNTDTQNSAYPVYGYG